MPCYDDQLKCLQQEVMNDLTRQGALLVPQQQQHDISVQSVCLSFLQRKQRARNRPKHLLTKDDVRLPINFGPINDKIKPVPRGGFKGGPCGPCGPGPRAPTNSIMARFYINALRLI